MSDVGRDRVQERFLRCAVEEFDGNGGSALQPCRLQAVGPVDDAQIRAVHQDGGQRCVETGQQGDVPPVDSAAAWGITQEEIRHRNGRAFPLVQVRGIVWQRPGVRDCERPRRTWHP
ncbi:hypothetical protein [Kitasatospora purpeofusca]|uniref:hypothetical protein n=1 Tax=Kitasatospora purpeofusca TaxID=67352 RepID=UPI00366765D0